MVGLANAYTVSVVSTRGIRKQLALKRKCNVDVPEWNNTRAERLFGHEWTGTWGVVVMEVVEEVVIEARTLKLIHMHKRIFTSYSRPDVTQLFAHSGARAHQSFTNNNTNNSLWAFKVAFYSGENRSNISRAFRQKPTNDIGERTSLFVSLSVCLSIYPSLR